MATAHRTPWAVVTSSSCRSQVADCLRVRPGTRTVALMAWQFTPVELGTLGAKAVKMRYARDRRRNRGCLQAAAAPYSWRAVAAQRGKPPRARARAQASSPRVVSRTASLCRKDPARNRRPSSRSTARWSASARGLSAAPWRACALCASPPVPCCELALRAPKRTTGRSRGPRNTVLQVNEDGVVLLDEFCQPAERVTDFRTFVSGVRAADLRGAAPFAAVRRRVMHLLAGRTVVAHAIKYDLQARRPPTPLAASAATAMIGTAASCGKCRYGPAGTAADVTFGHSVQALKLEGILPQSAIRDTATYGPLMCTQYSFGPLQPRSLRSLAANELRAVIQTTEHSPAEDARAAMYLYQRHRRAWEASLRSGANEADIAPTELEHVYG